MAPIAHAGVMHWYESIIYLIPIVGFGLWLTVTTIRDRRRGGKSAEDESEPPEGGLNRAERRAAERRARKERHS